MPSRSWKWLSSLTILAPVILWLILLPGSGAAGGGTHGEQAASLALLRRATLRITLHTRWDTVASAPLDGEKGGESAIPVTGRVERHGLGTLVRNGDCLYIVTHDHWGATEEASQVDFRNARGEPLLRITGDRFRSHIRYRDGGTLVLAAPATMDTASPEDLTWASETPPQEAPIALNIDEGGGLPDGDPVYIAHRVSEERVEFLPGWVQGIDRTRTPPVYEMVSGEGVGLAQGDSGGGVWSGAGLVGVNSAIRVQPLWAAITPLLRSVGARPPGVMLAIAFRQAGPGDLAGGPFQGGFSNDCPLQFGAPTPAVGGLRP